MCAFAIRDAAARPREFIFIDEAGFNLVKTRQGQNVMGQRTVVNGWAGLCAAISLQGVLHHHAILGPHNTAHIITFVDALNNAVVPERTRATQV